MKPVLIVGGGISGMTAAVEAVEAGIPVVLVESQPYLGGKAVAMNRYFPKMCPPYCGMEINFKRIKESNLVSLFVSSTVKKITGNQGNFTVAVESKPAYVNSNCTLCGDCSSVCPVDYPDEFNQQLSQKKAIDLAHDMAFPGKYYLEDEHCEKNTCSACSDACKYDAINLKAESRVTELDVRSIILATGWELKDPTKLDAYSFTKNPDILSSLMMERMSAPNGPTMGKIICATTKETPKTISFIQCAGSRDENHLPYCSGVCCSASLKQALHAVETIPDLSVNIHYIDLRVTGRNEDFLRKVEAHPRINLIKGKVVKVDSSDDASGLVLQSENIELGEKIKSNADMVVLATGIVPNSQALSNIFPQNRSYLDELKLEEGIYFAGSAQQPMDVSSSTKNATGSIIQAIQVSELLNQPQ